jgi:TM2 domain-containing membrane protein YozV
MTNGSAPPPSYKNAGLAAILSFFFMGLGQIYNGQIAKGIIFIVAYGISWILMLIIIGFITTPILWVYGIWDAYKSAEKINIELAQRAGAQTPPPNVPPTP